MEDKTTNIQYFLSLIGVKDAHISPDVTDAENLKQGALLKKKKKKNQMMTIIYLIFVYMKVLL